MIVLCAWCKKVIKEIKNVECEVSHGICEECLKELKKTVKN